MKEKNLLAKYWIQAAFFFLWWTICFFQQYNLTFLYVIMLMGFAFLNGRIGTKKRFIYTMIPVLYVAFFSVCPLSLSELNVSYVPGAVVTLLILPFLLLSGPVWCIRAAFAGVSCWFDVLSWSQLLIFAVLLAGAYLLGYLWEKYFMKKKEMAV